MGLETVANGIMIFSKIFSEKGLTDRRTAPNYQGTGSDTENGVSEMTKFGPGATVAVITFIARNAKNAIPTRALQGYAKGETLTAVVIKCAIGDKWLARIINNDGLDVDGIVNRSWEYKTARAKALLLASEI